MWQPNKIILHNLMTHVETEYEFQKNRCVMIFGRNLTDAGTDSNGTGKSTILEAISIAITGQTNREVKKDEFINDNSDDCFVQFDLNNNLGNINELSIRRWFHRKKSSKIEIWENGVLNEEMTSVNEANKRIYELIGLTKEDLLHFFIIGQDTNYSFLTAGDTEKKDIISRFSNIDFINDKIDELKANKKDLESEIDELDKDIQKLDNKNEFLVEQKEDLELNFEKEKSERIKRLKKKIAKYKTSKNKAEKDKRDNEIKLQETNDKISEISIKETEQLEKDIRTTKKDIRTKKDSLNQLKSDDKHYDLILEGMIMCPDCKHEFNPSEDTPLEDIPKLKKSNKSKREKLQKQIDSLNEKQKELEDELENNEELEDELSSLKRSLKKIELSLSTSDDEIKEYNSNIKRLKKKIKKIQKETSDKQIEDINIEIETNNEMLQVLQKSREDFEDDIQSADYWIYHFGKKGFMTYLTNKSVKSIEGITNSYLKKMNSDLQVNIDGFTKLKNGDIREKINIDIVRNGMVVGNYHRYSGGEKGRINLANILGLQKLINMTCDTGGLNLLALDEVFEGLDQSGQKDLLNILENLKSTSLVVTHRNQSIGAENELFIEKIDGISMVVSK